MVGGPSFSGLSDDTEHLDYFARMTACGHAVRIRYSSAGVEARDWLVALAA